MPGVGQTYVVWTMVLVVTVPEVATVATGQTTVVAVLTTVVTPPTVCVPDGTLVDEAPQTVVVWLTVMVVAEKV